MNAFEDNRRNALLREYRPDARRGNNHNIPLPQHNHNHNNRRENSRRFAPWNLLIFISSCLFSGIQLAWQSPIENYIYAIGMCIVAFITVVVDASEVRHLVSIIRKRLMYSSVTLSTLAVLLTLVVIFYENPWVIFVHWLLFNFGQGLKIADEIYVYVSGRRGGQEGHDGNDLEMQQLHHRHQQPQQYQQPHYQIRDIHAYIDCPVCELIHPIYNTVLV